MGIDNSEYFIYTTLLSTLPLWQKGENTGFESVTDHGCWLLCFGPTARRHHRSAGVMEPRTHLRAARKHRLWKPAPGCQNIVKRTTHNEQCPGLNCERESRRRRILSPGLFLDVISCRCVKHLHLIYKTCLYSCWMSEHSYRTQSGTGMCWVLAPYPGSGYGFCLAFVLPRNNL